METIRQGGNLSLSDLLKTKPTKHLSKTPEYWRRDTLTNEGIPSDSDLVDFVKSYGYRKPEEKLADIAQLVDPEIGMLTKGLLFAATTNFTKELFGKAVMNAGLDTNFFRKFLLDNNLVTKFNAFIADKAPKHIAQLTSAVREFATKEGTPLIGRRTEQLAALNSSAPLPKVVDAKKIKEVVEPLKPKVEATPLDETTFSKGTYSKEGKLKDLEDQLYQLSEADLTTPKGKQLWNNVYKLRKEIEDSNLTTADIPRLEKQLAYGQQKLQEAHNYTSNREARGTIDEASRQLKVIRSKVKGQQPSPKKTPPTTRLPEGATSGKLDLSKLGPLDKQFLIEKWQQKQPRFMRDVVAKSPDAWEADAIARENLDLFDKVATGPDKDAISFSRSYLEDKPKLDMKLEEALDQPLTLENQGLMDQIFELIGNKERQIANRESYNMRTPEKLKKGRKTGRKSSDFTIFKTRENYPYKPINVDEMEALGLRKRILPTVTNERGQQIAFEFGKSKPDILDTLKERINAGELNNIQLTPATSIPKRSTDISPKLKGAKNEAEIQRLRDLFSLFFNRKP